MVNKVERYIIQVGLRLGHTIESQAKVVLSTFLHHDNDSSDNDLSLFESLLKGQSTKRFY